MLHVKSPAITVDDQIIKINSPVENVCFGGWIVQYYTQLWSLLFPNPAHSRLQSQISRYFLT